MSGFKRLMQDVAGVWRTADRRTASLWTWGLIRRAPRILRTKSLVPADEALEPTRRCRFTVAGTSVLLPGRLFSAAREMYCRRVYQQEAGFVPEAGWAVVDLGANVGLFSVHAALAGATVVSIEAQTGMTPEFHDLAEANGVEGVTRVHALVGAGSGVLSSAENRGAASHWVDDTPERCLPDVLAEASVSHVDLMKIDIEGSEYDVFADPEWLGAVDRIVMEAHVLGGAPETIASILTSQGFSIRRRNNDLASVPRLVDTGYIYAWR